jgi:hypothetical protein
VRFSAAELIQRFFGSDPASAGGGPWRLWPRWLFLRGLGLLFFSAFYSLLFQVRGLVGPDGLLPAGPYLNEVTQYAGSARYWYAPTLLWLGSSDRALLAIVWVGIASSLLLVLNVWPRLTIAICEVCFLSFIAGLQAFSSYQSDGMLLEAGFISLFFAPPGIRPGLGERHPPSRASLFLLQWEWLRIYFESGVAKIASGDPEWRHLTAMIDYYQNGPLPTWIAWYAAHLPRWFHVGTAGLTLALEVVLIWAFLLPRPFRIALFWLVTPWEIGIILTSNYAFLNYLVLAAGILLLDDDYVRRWLPERMRRAMEERRSAATAQAAASGQAQKSFFERGLTAAGVAVPLFFLTWIFYATTAQMVWMVWRDAPLPTAPVVALEPFRIANQFGLFAVMTRGRYEIEFQGSTDGETWTPYPFRYKPQDVRAAPRIFAPYQPRFDWNLWFASLDSWQQNDFVVAAEERLLTNSQDVLALFAGNPFAGAPPFEVRAMIWQYWFTDSAEKKQGLWWRRESIGLYAPSLVRSEGGKFAIVSMPVPGMTPRP